MQTKHYLIENLTDFSEDKDAVENLKNYLADIEKVFPVIEEVFGQSWNDDYIHIILTREGNPSHRRKRIGDVHIIKLNMPNKAIQIKKYPENLWGCLFHETLHAFKDSIVKKGNDLNNNDSDERPRPEPFIEFFHTMVYLRLKNKNIIKESLYRDFLNYSNNNLISDNSKKVYKRYMEIFKNPDNFSNFIAYLNLSETALIKKESFWQDLKKAEEYLNQN